MPVDFTQLLSDAKLGEIEKPKPLPAGSYEALINDTSFGELQNDNKTPYLEVSVTFVGAFSDVNPEELEEFGGEMKLREKKMKFKLFLTENALHMLQEFILDHVGLDATGKSIIEVIPELVGNSVGVKVQQQISQRDNETLVSFIDGTFNPASMS